MAMRLAGPAQDVYVVGSDVPGGGGSSTITAPLGRAADAASVSMAISTEDAALLSALLTTAAFQARIPALGPAAAAASTPVTLANDGIFATSFGLPADTEATNDTGSFSFMSFVKRLLNTKLKIGQQTKAASLSVSLASDYQAPVLPTNLTASGSAASLNTDIVPSFDCSNYRVGSVQLTGFGGATISVQFSNDGGTTWVTTRVRNINTGSVSTAINTNGIYVFEIPAATLCRIRATAYSSGTIAGNAFFTSLTTIPTDIGGTQLVSTSGSASDVNSRSDGTTNALTALATNSKGFLYNGTTIDVERGMTANTVLASAARTATASTDVTNFNGRSFAAILNITVAPNTASTLTIAIRVKDSISGNYVTLLTAVAITGSVVTGSVPVTNRYVVALGVTVAANVAAAEALGRTMNVLVTHSNADSWTYSISADIGV